VPSVTKDDEPQKFNDEEVIFPIEDSNVSLYSFVQDSDDTNDYED
jgi:hypothetical protein